MSKTFLYIFIFLSENDLYVHSGILCVIVLSPLPKTPSPSGQSCFVISSGLFIVLVVFIDDFYHFVKSGKALRNFSGILCILEIGRQ